MTLRSIVFLVLALLVAGATAMYARNWMAAQRLQMQTTAPAPKAAVAETQVLVAGVALSAGTFVKAEHLRWQTWPSGGLAEGYVVKDKRELKDFVGAVVRSTVTAGQPITDSVLVRPGDRGFLAAVLTPGMRAVSVPVNATSGISGFVFPGDWVDLLLTAKFQESGNSPEGGSQTRHLTQTLLSDIRVLAIDQQVDNSKGLPVLAKTATLEVSPKQAEKIALALDMGALSLSLRSLAAKVEPLASGPAATGGEEGSFTLDQDVHTLFGRGKARTGGGGGSKVEVLRGGKAETVTFR